MKVVAVALLLVAFEASYSYGSIVEIGEFVQKAANVPGLVSFTSASSIVISGFSFSGDPPDTFVYSYAPGVEVNATGGGTIIPVTGTFATSEGGFQSSVPLNNIELRIELPPAMTVCDIGTLTVWCREVGVIFSVLPIPDAAFASRSPCRLASTRSLVGNFNGSSDVSGSVHATGPNTVVIENFNFNYVSTRGAFYYFPRNTATGGSVSGAPKIPAISSDANSLGGFEATVTNGRVVLELNGTDLCNVGIIAFGLQTAPNSVLAEFSFRTNIASTVAGGACLLGVEILGRAVVGMLPTNQNRTVGGVVQFLSEATIYVRNLRYSDTVTDASLFYFNRGEAVNATYGGTMLPLPDNVPNDQGRFVSNQPFSSDVYIRLPEGVSVCDIGAIAVISRSNGVVLSYLPVAPSLTDSTVNCSVNSGTVIAGYLNGIHDVTGFVRITGTTSFVLENFNFNGQAPDTFVYAYAPGATVNPSGGGFLLPISGPLSTLEGGFVPFQAVSVESLSVQLPSGNDVCDIGHFSIWCRQVGVLFAVLEISTDLFVMGGRDPCSVEVEPRGGSGGGLAPLDNCIPLGNSLQASWTLDETNGRVNFRLCGCQGLDPRTPQYLGFGISGSSTSTTMDGADVAITWVDAMGRPNAVDYHLQSGRRYQCRDGMGVCPDVLDARGNCTNDLFGVAGTVIGKQQCIAYSRRLTTADGTCDLPINSSNSNQYVVWAVGGLGQTAFKHFERSPIGDGPINLARSPLNSCTQPLTCTSCKPFTGRQMKASTGNTFTVLIGPSGNERGYMGITGRPGWGIAWYVNDVLIPELVVERGTTYTFVIHGGNNAQDLANYHPFYISSSIQGGRLRNSAADKASEVVYAGFNENNEATWVGNLCEKSEPTTAREVRESCGSFEDYLAALSKPECTNPGTFTWKPDKDTPDRVYYQCATHLNLGYRIVVQDPPASGAPLPLPGVAVLLSVVLVALYLVLLV